MTAIQMQFALSLCAALFTAALLHTLMTEGLGAKNMAPATLTVGLYGLAIVFIAVFTSGDMLVSYKTKIAVVLPYVLSCVAVITEFIKGSGVHMRWVWKISFACQFLWIGYTISSGAYGFAPLNALLLIVFARNYRLVKSR